MFRVSVGMEGKHLETSRAHSSSNLFRAPSWHSTGNGNGKGNRNRKSNSTLNPSSRNTIS